MGVATLEVEVAKRDEDCLRECITQATIELPSNIIIKVVIDGQPLRCLLVVTDEGIVFLGDPDNPERKWKLPSRP